MDKVKVKPEKSQQPGAKVKKEKNVEEIEHQTGVQLARLQGVVNQGPRAPVRGRVARDQAPLDPTVCRHEGTEHGGNKKAFWKQCKGCRMHLEYYPRRGTKLSKAETIEHFQYTAKDAQQNAAAANIKRDQTAVNVKTEARTTPVHSMTGNDAATEVEEESSWTNLVEEEMIPHYSPRTQMMAAMESLATDHGANRDTHLLIEAMRMHLTGADAIDAMRVHLAGNEAQPQVVVFPESDPLFDEEHHSQ